MSAAAVEHPCHDEPVTLLEAADKLTEQLPGYRVEIIGGILTATPPADGAHARGLTKLMRPFMMAGLDGGETEVLQNVGLWLPGGPEDFAIPDLALVDADFEEHHVKSNCYDPVCFRLALEVTSSNYQQDLRDKVAAYAEAQIPVYVIIDGKHGRIHVLTEPNPAERTYDTHRVAAPGEQITLPESIGAEVKLDVEALLRGATPKKS
ncbi:Uma2 family endonuclease [Streptomyces sp. HNM0663]|uniref:Uma2 family endonuclease n=1 Tax=Streptomyces chengmaiensis TaxID=3040919 RepID=A0ABT6HVJ6_9ACTN|nr:Uma2 family endonuclease [Streptomyces chengmaiensis]MDH2392064.1 Uma2 family endonuclease [Streptomyces chengmaiensis]